MKARTWRHVERAVRPGDRVVIPFNISCGSCFMCSRGLQSKCGTTQVHEHGTGASSSREPAAGTVSRCR